jgi:tubulin-specific chaperone D
VRWSAAKGLGRIAARLPEAFGDEVVSSLLNVLLSDDSDAAWHGAALALADAARRGVLLPPRLKQTIPLVLRVHPPPPPPPPHSRRRCNLTNGAARPASARTSATPRGGHFFLF